MPNYLSLFWGHSVHFTTKFLILGFLKHYSFNHFLQISTKRHTKYHNQGLISSSLASFHLERRWPQKAVQVQHFLVWLCKPLWELRSLQLVTRAHKPCSVSRARTSKNNSPFAWLFSTPAAPCGRHLLPQHAQPCFGQQIFKLCGLPLGLIKCIRKLIFASLMLHLHVSLQRRVGRRTPGVNPMCYK